MRTINVKKQKSKIKTLPFKSHKVREDRKLFTLKVIFLCCSLFTLILMESKIVKVGKQMLKAPTRTKSARVIANYANPELEVSIKEALEKSHELIFNTKLPKNHFKISVVSKDKSNNEEEEI